MAIKPKKTVLILPLQNQLNWRVSQVPDWHYLRFVFPHSSSRKSCSYPVSLEWWRAWDKQNFMGCEKQPSTGFVDTEPLWVLHFSQYATQPVAPHPSHAPFLHSVKPPVHLPITSQLPPPHPLSLHLLLWTAGSQCVILFIPCFFPPLLSPLHPSIPFFHVCSAVKPSSIRPASLITCTLC